VRLEGLGKLEKNPMTSGIEPETFRLVEERKESGEVVRNATLREGARDCICVSKVPR
jgi:hypothetical protein